VNQVTLLTSSEKTHNVHATRIHPWADLQVLELSQPVQIQEPRLCWFNVSKLIGTIEQKSGKRRRLDKETKYENEEIEVIIVGAMHPGRNEDIDEHGVLRNAALTLTPHDKHYIRGYIRRSELENNTELYFSEWQRLTLRDNGAGVYVRNTKGDLELIGVISGDLMRNNPSTSILNITHHHMKIWLESLP
jgi:hypothetical protein